MHEWASFAEVITPQDPEFADIMRTAWEGGADLREAFSGPDSVEFLKWLGTSGVLEHPEQMGRFYPPVPPDQLRYYTSGGKTPLDFMRTSVDDFHVLFELWETFSGRPLRSLRSVYDFGCGCGRLLRWFSVAVPDAKLHGSEVHRDNLRWCQENLQGRFLLNGHRPPVDLPDGCAELVYSVSVFSHLNEEANRQWIAELARVCSPDGLIILSTLSAFTLMVIGRSEEHQGFFQIDAAHARVLQRQLARDGFVFHPISREIISTLDGVEDVYGQTFTNENWLRSNWGDVVELVAYVPAFFGLQQDVAVLRPR